MNKPFSARAGGSRVILACAAGGSALLGVLIATENFGLAMAILAGVVAFVFIRRLPSALGCSIMLATAAFTHPLSEALDLSVGPVRVEPIDLGLMAFVVFAVFGIRPSPPSFRSERFFRLGVAAMVAALGIPVLVGLANGHDWQSVLRAGRVVAYFATFFVSINLVRHRRDRLIIVWTVALLGASGALFLLLSRLLGWQWSNGMSDVFIYGGTVSRGYGWWSTMPWFVYAAVVILSHSWLSDEVPGPRRLAGAFLFVGLGIATVSTLIRGDFVGLVLGSGAIVLMGLRLSPGQGHAGRLVTGSTLVGVAIWSAFLLAGPVPALDVAAERLSSIITPSQTAVTGAGTRAYRLIALANGLRSGLEHPFGIGFGYPSSGPDGSLFAIAGWATHSSIAWMGYFLGWVGALLLTAGAQISWMTAHRHRVIRHGWEVVAMVGILVAMMGQSLAANVLFGNMFTYPIVPVLLAGIASAFPRTEDDRHE